MAAGLGFKTFTTGEVLTAGDVNGYLMQGINVFASEAARNAAITSPQEGQFAFTKDNNSLWYYTGSAWVASGATGDIEGVTAGVGISGGGTSGTVTVTNSMATAIDAKADLIVGTGADTFSRLGVGANNTVLTADSAEATGLKWATPAGGGKILQVVTATTSTSTSNATNTYADTTLTANITPSSASSRVMVIVMHPYTTIKGAQEVSIDIQLLRDATVIHNPPSPPNSFFIGGAASSAWTNIEHFGILNFSILDSPATTSAITYKTQFKAPNAGTIQVQRNGYTSTIILLEVGP